MKQPECHFITLASPPGRFLPPHGDHMLSCTTTTTTTTTGGGGSTQEEGNGLGSSGKTQDTLFVNRKKLNKCTVLGLKLCKRDCGKN